MGVCLSKAGPAHRQLLSNDEDGFCTPECVSSQYESPNPSGRYSFANAEASRISCDPGDLGALGSLFCRRANRSKGTNYIVPLDMFLGGVSGRNRVHHVNQICKGDYSFSPYLASPLLKGFDVHAMEAVARAYAESAAKAAARDTFIFLEENDLTSVFEGGNTPGKDAAAVGAEDSGDADEDLAKSGESEDWEEPRKPENWNERENVPNGVKNEVTNDRWVSVLTAVQARARARRRHRKSTPGKGQAARGASKGAKTKTVRFQLALGDDGFTDDDVRSGKESDHEKALDTEADDFFISGDGAAHLVKGDDYVEHRGVDEVKETAVEGCYGPGCVDAVACRMADSVEGPALILQEDEIVDEEFLGFAATEGFDGGATPLITPSSQGPTRRIHRPSREYFSASEDFAFATHFGASHQEKEVNLMALPDVEDYDEAVGAGSGQAEREEFRVVADGDKDSAKQSSPAECTLDCDDASFVLMSGGIQKASSSLHDGVVSKLTGSAIPALCPVVIVDSRKAEDCGRTLKILEVSDRKVLDRSEDQFGFFHTGVSCSRGTSPSRLDLNSDQEGSFSFPILCPSTPSPETSPFREHRGLWRDAPVADTQSPIRICSVGPNPSLSSDDVHEVHEVTSPRNSCSDDMMADARCSFSFDQDHTITRKPHEIVLPSLPSRSLSASPVFSPSKLVISPIRSSPVSPIQLAPNPSPSRARRSLNKRLKFYSLERASCAAGAKRSKSPPSFIKKERRRQTGGESDSDLFEIPASSGTNTPGTTSPRTPPSTPTKSLKLSSAAPFDFEKLSKSIARVSQSRAKKNSSVKPVPLGTPFWNSKGQYLPTHGRDAVFQEGLNAFPAWMASQTRHLSSSPVSCQV